MSIAVLANIGEAIGTISAVLVALFLNVYLVRRRHPRHSMSISLNEADGNLALVDERPALFYIRPRVWNRINKETSKDVEVLLLGIDYPKGDYPASICPSRNFGWADTPAEQVRIPGGTWRRFDAIALISELKCGTAPICVPNLKVYGEGWPPPDRHRLTAPGRYTFRLVITSENSESSYWSLRFVYAPRPVNELTDPKGRITHIELVRAKQPKVP